MENYKLNMVSHIYNLISNCITKCAYCCKRRGGIHGSLHKINERKNAFGNFRYDYILKDGAV